MTRSLRTRRSRVNYAAMMALGDGDAEENDDATARLVAFEAEDSGSDFAPEARQAQDETEEEEEEEGSDDDDASQDGALDPDDTLDDELIAFSTSKKSGSKSKKRVPGATTIDSRLDVIKPVFGGASLPRSSKRQMYALPTQSINHRHRAIPLFSLSSRIERLAAAPRLFRAPSVTPTNNMTSHLKVTDRVSKAWGFNVGPGPLWELLEDRGWFKEASSAPENNIHSDASSRPLVHLNIRLRSDVCLLSQENAEPYLPREASNDQGAFQSPPSIPCSYGPFEKQTRVDLNIFESFPLSRYISENEHSHVFNPGAPVWGLDWCPIHSDQRAARSYKQYLAVGPLPSLGHSPEVGAKVTRPSKACIQIWSLSPSSQGAEMDLENDRPDPGIFCCEMVLCIDSGAAIELKWCPLPSHDSLQQTSLNQSRKLGLLGGIFEDGTFCVYVVPDPSSMRTVEQDPSRPIYVHLPEPLIRIQLEETNCLSFDWGNSELIGIGTTHGTLAIYHLGTVLRALGPDDNHTVLDNILPTHYLTVHQSAVRTVAWIRAPPSFPDGALRLDGDPTIICSGGYDGMVSITDIREGHGSVINRTRDVINTMTFSHFAGGPITIDHENIVKAYSASPSMLGRGHLLIEPQGPVWSVNSSDYHPQLAVGSADGSCYTTNTLRSTRRGGQVPFFVHRIYQLDYSRKTGEYRMLDQFLPQETPDKPTASRPSKKIKQPQVHLPSTGTWPRQIGVQRVVWNTSNGLSSSGLLASSTGSGLCRIDVLWGRFLSDRVPYNGIEWIRMEKGELNDNGMDIDSDSAEDA